MNSPVAAQDSDVFGAGEPRFRLRRAADFEAPRPQPLLSASDVYKAYRRGSVEVPVLQGVDFSAAAGKLTAIVGQSGSGKSTLLHLLGTLDRPDAGEVHFGDRRVDNLSRAGRDAFRNQDIGFIFQFYHLLPELTTLENVMLPLMIGQPPWRFLRHRRSLRRRAEELLELVGLSHRLNHRPRELSGGEMQRTAIARALIARPRLLLADEPTGNLDRQSGGAVLELLQHLKEHQGLTIIMVTHDEAVAKRCDHIVRLVEGRVESVA